MAFIKQHIRSRLAQIMDAGLFRVGEILELTAVEPEAESTRFEVIAVDPRTGLIEARSCEANRDGEHWLIRMRLQRLQ